MPFEICIYHAKMFLHFLQKEGHPPKARIYDDVISMDQKRIDSEVEMLNKLYHQLKDEGYFKKGMFKEISYGV